MRDFLFLMDNWRIRGYRVVSILAVLALLIAIPAFAQISPATRPHTHSGGSSGGSTISPSVYSSPAGTNAAFNRAVQTSGNSCCSVPQTIIMDFNGANQGRWTVHGQDNVSQAQVLFQSTSADGVTLVTNFFNWNAGTLTLDPGSTAGVAIKGSADGSTGAVGNVGEVFEQVVTTGSSIALTTATSANVSQINLTAGDWETWGAIAFTFGATTSYTNLAGGISQVSATLPAQYDQFDFETPATVPTAGKDMTWVVPRIRITTAAPVSIFLVAQGVFTVSTLRAYGHFYARRIR